MFGFDAFCLKSTHRRTTPCAYCQKYLTCRQPNRKHAYSISSFSRVQWFGAFSSLASTTAIDAEAPEQVVLKHKNGTQRGQR